MAVTSTTAASASSSSVSAKDTTGGLATKQTPPSRGIDLLTGPEGEVLGVTVSPVMQLYATVDQLVAASRVVALPVDKRYMLAGKVAAVPDEHPRLVERLASGVATALTEAGALNALYLLETCKELVPGFEKCIPSGRLDQAAELSPHARVKAAIQKGEKPAEWTQAAQRAAPASVVLFQPEVEEEEGSLLDDAGRAVGDATKFVGGAAFGGVGLVTDTLGLTDNAEDELAAGAEDAVDLVGDGINTVVDTVDNGIEGTADDFAEKGVVGAVGDGVNDAADLITDFTIDAVTGIAGGVKNALDWISGDKDRAGIQGPITHKVAIVVAELIGEEKSLGLRIENRIVTSYTKPEAGNFGWKQGDCIIGVGRELVHTQEAMLASIAEAKKALQTSGTPIRFLVERLDHRPAGF